MYVANCSKTMAVKECLWWSETALTDGQCKELDDVSNRISVNNNSYLILN